MIRVVEPQGTCRFARSKMELIRIQVRGRRSIRRNFIRFPKKNRRPTWSDLLNSTSPTVIDEAGCGIAGQRGRKGARGAQMHVVGLRRRGLRGGLERRRRRVVRQRLVVVKPREHLA